LAEKQQKIKKENAEKLVKEKADKQRKEEKDKKLRKEAKEKVKDIKKKKSPEKTKVEVVQVEKENSKNHPIKQEKKQTSLKNSALKDKNQVKKKPKKLEGTKPGSNEPKINNDITVETDEMGIPIEPTPKPTTTPKLGDGAIVVPNPILMTTEKPKSKKSTTTVKTTPTTTPIPTETKKTFNVNKNGELEPTIVTVTVTPTKSSSNENKVAHKQSDSYQHNFPASYESRYSPDENEYARRSAILNSRYNPIYSAYTQNNPIINDNMYNQRYQRSIVKRQSIPQSITSIAKGLLAKKATVEQLQGYKNYNITADTVDKLAHLAKSCKMTIIFDIGIFDRKSKDDWNMDNAKQLVEYCQSKQYRWNYQLGNEPNHYKKFGKDKDLSPEQVGADYRNFRYKVLRSIGKKDRPMLIGPEVTRPKPNRKTNEYLNTFLKSAKNRVDRLSFHQYYFDGKTATEQDFINPYYFNLYREQTELINEVAVKSNYTKGIWLTETSSAWGGGAKDLSNRYADVLLYLDKLGISAQNNISVVCRQSFMAGKYALVDYKKDYRPNPSYFLAYIYRMLVAERVLNIKGGDENLRVYAHCSKPSDTGLLGAITVYIVNLNKNDSTFSFRGYETLEVQQYLLTSDDLTSDTVKLNGKELKMEGNDLPEISPIPVTQPISIPALSCGFYVLETVMALACDTSEE